MVETRSGLKTDKRGSFLSTSTLLVTSVLIAAVAVSTSYVAFESFEHKAHSLYERGRYAFGGADGAAREYWASIPSWEELKGQADSYATAGGQRVLPEPSLWESTKAFVLRKPVRQVQAEGAYARGKEGAADAAAYAKDTAEAAKQKAAGAADATSEYAGEFKKQAQSVPDKVRQLLFGIKTKAVKESERSRRIAADAQWRAEYNAQEGFLAKLKHVVLGPAKAPSTQHYDAAKDAGSQAYDHTAKAAAEAYEAAKDAAAGVVSGAKGAARSAQGAAASASDVGGRAAASAGQAYDASKDAAGTAAEYAQAGYDKSAEAAAAAKDKAGQAYAATADAAGQAADKAGAAYQAAADAARSATGSAGLTAEQAAHRAQEAAQQAQHRAQETYHQATA